MQHVHNLTFGFSKIIQILNLEKEKVAQLIRKKILKQLVI